MANLETEFCGIHFKNPVVVASIEPTNSPEMIRECVDAGAGGMIVKTLTDIEEMAVLTENSKYAILNDKGDIIRGKIPHDFRFYSRSGYSTTPVAEWVPHLKALNRYAKDNGSVLIGSAGGKTLQSWKDICRTIEDCGLADGRAELRLSASRDDAGRARRLDDRSGARRRLRGGARRQGGVQHPDRGQAHARPVAAARRRAPRARGGRRRRHRHQPLHRLRGRHRDRRAAACGGPPASAARGPSRCRCAGCTASTPSSACRSPARTASTITATSSSSS